MCNLTLTFQPGQVSALVFFLSFIMTSKRFFCFFFYLVLVAFGLVVIILSPWLSAVFVVLTLWPCRRSVDRGGRLFDDGRCGLFRHSSRNDGGAFHRCRYVHPSIAWDKHDKRNEKCVVQKIAPPHIFARGWLQKIQPGLVISTINNVSWLPSVNHFTGQSTR